MQNKLDVNNMYIIITLLNMYKITVDYYNIRYLPHLPSEFNLILIDN